MNNFRDQNLSDRINLIRGTAIVLMIWGHCIQYCNGGTIDFYEDVAYKFIYSFHMPLFMLISGYLFFFSAKKRSLQELINHKISALFYPILTFSIINQVLTFGIDSIINGTSGVLLESISLFRLWFLWSVLLSSLILSISIKHTENLLVKGIILILGIGIISLFPGNEMHCFMYPYFIIGFLTAKHAKTLKNYFRVIGLLSCCGYALMIPHYSTKHYIYTTRLFGGVQ